MINKNNFIVDIFDKRVESKIVYYLFCVNKMYEI